MDSKQYLDNRHGRRCDGLDNGASDPQLNGSGAADPDSGTADDGQMIDAILSATGPDWLQVGRIGVIQNQLEVAGEAAPLDVSTAASIRVDKEVLMTDTG